MRLDTLPEQMVSLEPSTRSATFECLQSPDPVRPPLFDEYLRAELGRTDGTPEHCAWRERARLRHPHLVPT